MKGNNFDIGEAFLLKVNFNRMFNRMLNRLYDLAHRNRTILFFYLLLGVAMRFFSFHRSVIDWDESTYLLGAKALLQNQTLYVDFWDFKPPGIFWLFAGLQALFDDAIVAARILGCLLVVGTAFFINRIFKQLWPKEPIGGLMAGVLFIGAISFNTIGFSLTRGTGLEVNTEHFFIFFSCLGVWLFLRKPDQIFSVFAAGLALGAGFVVKYFVLADFIAICSLAFFLQDNGKIAWSLKPSLKKTMRLAWLTIGFVLPFGLVVLYYYQSPQWGVFSEMTFGGSARYSGELRVGKMVGYWMNFFYLGGIATTCFVGVMLTGWKKEGHWRRFGAPHLLLCWLGGVLLGTALVGKNHIHYLYQAFPPFVLLAGLLFSSRVLKKKALRNKVTGIITAVVLALVPVVAVLKVRFLFGKEDVPRSVAAYVEKHTTEGGLPLFIFNDYHIVYYLIDCLPPTRYYHPSLLYNSKHVHTSGVDANREHQNILRQKPAFILYNDKKASSSFLNRIKDHYEVDTTFAKHSVLYKRK